MKFAVGARHGVTNQISLDRAPSTSKKANSRRIKVRESIISSAALFAMAHWLLDACLVLKQNLKLRELPGEVSEGYTS